MKEKLFKDKELEGKFWKTIDKINEEVLGYQGLKLEKREIYAVDYHTA